MARDHIEHLFSAALDDALTPREQATFDAHLHACTACVDAYARFRASVEALRELPRARMPHPVHLPSTPPVAELRPRWRRLPRAPRPQFRFGGATAIALAGAAVVIAIGLTRPSNTTTTSESGSSAALAPGRAAGSASSPCQPQLASHVSAAPPAGYDYAQSRTDPRRPGQTLTIATVTSEAAPGADVIVFAQLTLPVPQLGAPGVAATPVETAALPCLSVDRAGATAITPGGAQFRDVAPEPKSHAVAGAAQASPSAAEPLLAFTVPPGAKPGTVLQVVATVPAGYPHAGDPPFSVTLEITVR